MSKPTFNSETKVWSGPREPPFYNPDQNLGKLIIKVLELTPDVVTQVSADTGVEVTCGEMRERILKLAVHLSDLGLKQGDVVGVVATNTENLAPAVFACFLLGLPVNPLAPIMTEADIVQMYSKTKPKLILCDEGNLRTVQNAVKTMKSDAKIYTIMEDVAGYRSVTEILKKSTKVTDFIYPDVDSSATAVILCTSGSTSAPKGVIKSHKNLILESIPHTSGQQIVLQYSAIFWFSGFYFLIKSTLYKYKRVITSQRIDRDVMVEIINKHKITLTLMPPFAIVSLLQMEDLRPFESMKCWMVGGSAVSKELCSKFKPYIPNAELLVGYGCSEQGIFTGNRSVDKCGSSGSPICNTHFKVIDDDGNALDNNQRGEICSKIDSKFLGYFDEPEKSQEAFDGEWFKTGDIGYFDDDGYVYILDRKKELLKYNNFPVTSTELEAVINEIQGVASSCVVGVPEELTGNDIIHAFVIVEGLRKLTAAYIESFVNERVIDQKRLRGGVHFVSTFPVGLSGKVDRKQMRSLAAEKIKIS